tara:strand:+ start:254 stop:517 length:264 start_codon:yes stop_codon:yes gene_type:complete
MKKLLPALFLATVLSLSFGCEEEECVSNCGTITDDAILSALCESTDGYSLTIRNECSNNLETFCIYYTDWIGAYVGNQFCITNVTSW